MAAEYIMSEGNYNVVLCERGMRTFADHTRNTLDLSVVPAVQKLSHLPIIVDPSHGTGKRDKRAAAGPRRGRRGRRRPASSKCITIRTTRSPTDRSRCIPSSSPSWSRNCATS